MIGVGGVTGTTGALAAALVGEAVLGQTTAGSGFGPTFLLGGMLGGNSPIDTAQGLYNSLGQLIGAQDPKSVARARAFSATETRRRAALEAAAERINAGDAQGGRAAAKAMLKKNSQDASALALVGRSYVLERDYKQAEKYYSRAAALAPDHVRIQSDLANTRTLQGSDDEVLVVARRELKNPSTRNDALRLLFDLADRSPLNVDVYLALADGFKAGRKPLQSLLSLQKAQAFANKNTVAGVIERAEAFVEKHPDIGMGHNLLGRALQKAGRTREGLRELQAARSIAPDNVGYGNDLAAAYVARAETRIEAGDLQSATADLHQAYAITLVAKGYGEATARLEAAVGKQHVDAGRYTLAVQHLNRAKANAPDDEVFKDQLALEYLRVAKHYQSEGDTGFALTNYRAANELDPDSFTAAYNTALLSHAKGVELRDDGKYELAIEHFRRAYELRPTKDVYRQDLADAYDRQGVILDAIGELDEAFEHFQTGYRLDPSNEVLAGHYNDALAQRNGA